MYIPSRGVIIRDEIRRENKQRESDTRKGIWRYNT